MRTAEDYRKQAQEALELAQRARESERPTLMQIAEIWIKLADQREAELRAVRPPETPKLKEASSV
jgi:hypothetical protein